MQPGDQVVSKFSFAYYFRCCCGAVFFVYLTGRLLYFLIFGNPAYPGKVMGMAAILLVSTVIFFYFFSKSWKKVTVGPMGIVVDYLAFKKQLVVPYPAITHMGTYSSTRGDRNGWSFGHDFIIEFGKDSIGINDAYYNNYSSLKAAVYNYTLGFDRQRSQY